MFLIFGLMFPPEDLTANFKTSFVFKMMVCWKPPCAEKKTD